VAGCFLWHVGPRRALCFAFADEVLDRVQAAFAAVADGKPTCFSYRWIFDTLDVMSLCDTVDEPAMDRVAEQTVGTIKDTFRDALLALHPDMAKLIEEEARPVE